MAGSIAGVGFHPDGKQIMVASGDGTITLRDRHTGRITKQLKHETSFRFRAVLAPDGQHVLSCGDTSAIWWDLATGQPIRTLAVPNARRSVR